MKKPNSLIRRRRWWKRKVDEKKEEALKELSFIAIDLNNFYYLDALVARNLDINSSLLYAISKNNTQIVYHFLLIGAKNYDQALEFAENQNATEIIEMIKEFKYANTVMSSIAAWDYYFILKNKI